MATIRFRGLGDSHCLSRGGGVGDNHGARTVMTSRTLSRLCTLSPGNTSFITVSFPSCKPQTVLVPSPSPAASPASRHVPTSLSLSPPSLSPHRFGQEELQLAILQHVDAGIRLAGAENVVALWALLENHVLAKLQEQRLLEVAQDPAGTRTGTAGDTERIGTRPGPPEPSPGGWLPRAWGCRGKSIRQRSGPGMDPEP